MTIPLNSNSLLQLLRSRKLEPILEPKSQNYYITMHVNTFEVQLFFVIMGENDLVQLISYFPFRPTPTTVGEIARWLHLINRDIDLPGFGLDERENILFYRLVIPCINHELSVELFCNYVAASRLACDSFINGIGLIATGSAKMEQVLKAKKDGK